VSTTAGPTPGTASSRRTSSRTPPGQVPEYVVDGPDLFAGLLPHGVVKAHTPLYVRFAVENAQEVAPALGAPQGHARAARPAPPRRSRLAALISALWIRMKCCRRDSVVRSVPSSGVGMGCFGGANAFFVAVAGGRSAALDMELGAGRRASARSRSRRQGALDSSRADTAWAGWTGHAGSRSRTLSYQRRRSVRRALRRRSLASAVRPQLRDVNGFGDQEDSRLRFGVLTNTRQPERYRYCTQRDRTASLRLFRPACSTPVPAGSGGTASSGASAGHGRRQAACDGG
jgi:hypothetical protein